jgi:hypothetical protein
MQPQIWIGTVEVYLANPETPSVSKPAYTNVTTWACDADEFGQKCRRMLESYGWKLLGIARANPVSGDDKFSDEIADMLERTRTNPNATIYGTFHTYPIM